MEKWVSSRHRLGSVFGREREVLVERRVEVLHSAGGREVGFLGFLGLLRGHCEVEMLGLWWDWVFVFR
jgi:hypothetical protein